MINHSIIAVIFKIAAQFNCGGSARRGNDRLHWREKVSESEREKEWGRMSEKSGYGIRFHNHMIR